MVFLVSFSKQNIFTTVTNRYEASKHIPNNQTAQNKQKYSIFPDLAQDRIYIRKPCDQKKTCLYIRQLKYEPIPKIRTNLSLATYFWR